MKRNLTAILVLMAMFMLLRGNAHAAANNLQDVKSYSEGKDFKIQLLFEREPEISVNYFERSVQVDIAGASVHPSKRAFDVENARIKSMNIYQVKPELLRIRVFPKGDMKSLREELSVTKEGSKLVFALGKMAVLPATSAKGEKLTAETNSASPSAAPVSAAPELSSEEKASASAEKETKESDSNTKESQALQGTGEDLLKNIQKSLDEIKKEENKSPASPAAQGNLPEPVVPAAPPQAPPTVPTMGEAFVKIGSALMIVIALIIAVSYGAKKYLGTMETGLGTKKQLKVLSNHFIGVKKNVTIIEVGGEILVLGVTNSNVNLLARYSEPEKIEAIRLAHRLPDRPLGYFKRFSVFGWMKKKEVQKPMNPAFAKQVGSYALNMKLAEEEKMDPRKIETRREELVSNVTRSIKERMRTFEEAAG